MLVLQTRWTALGPFCRRMTRNISERPLVTFNRTSVIGVWNHSLGRVTLRNISGHIQGQGTLASLTSVTGAWTHLLGNVTFRNTISMVKHRIIYTSAIHVWKHFLKRAALQTIPSCTLVWHYTNVTGAQNHIIRSVRSWNTIGCILVTNHTSGCQRRFL
jgi:hypothetical protein